MTVSDVVYSIVSLVSTFFMYAAIIVFLQCFYDNGIRWSRKKGAAFLVCALVQSLVSLFFGEHDILSILFAALNILIAVYDCKGKRIRRALRFLISYIIVSWSVALACLFGFIYLLPGFDIFSETSSQTEGLLIYIISGIFFAVVFFYLEKRLVRRDIFIRCGKRENLVIAAYCVITFVILEMAVISEMEAGTARIALTAFAFVCFAAIITFPVVFFYSRLSSYYRRANELHESYMQFQLEHFRQYKAAQEETARFRHDIKNNLQCINELLSSGKDIEASQYLSELIDEVRQLSPEYVSGDEILDCIISSKASVMKREGIRFALDGVIPGGLGWSAIDVCNVFANALDNAIESCMNMPADKRYISLSIKSSEQFRYIRIVNCVVGAVDTEKLFNESGGYTSKKHTSGHGMGTYSIRRTVEKYGGVVRAECTDSVFTLELIVNKSSSF